MAYQTSPLWDIMNRFRFDYRAVPAWPPLAWLSYCRSGAKVIEVFYGPGVETTDEWFGEIIWAGNFEDGEFDQTEVAAGSGGRIRKEEVIFVSSGSTVDRLQSLPASDGIMISNSLSCLLAMAGGSFDPAYPHFHVDFSSVNYGLSKYTRQISSSAGPVELTYFDNLLWTGKALHCEAKKMTAPEFTTFEEYREFMGNQMQAFVTNATTPGRHQQFRPLCTLSNGYDSPTVAVLARHYGRCREAVSIDVDREGSPDNGEAIAKHLGMTCTLISREEWRSLDQPEIPFIAGTPGGSDVVLAAAKRYLAGTVLFTGYNGTGAWGKHSKDGTSELARSDGSGRSLTEFRLGANFIHCPVPYWGARRSRALLAISHSRAMQPWDVPGSYSKPIARRLVEEAGVPRGLFGTKKKGVSVQLYHPDSFLTPAAYQDYLFWLQENRMAWIRKSRIPPIPFIANGMNATLSILMKTLSGVETSLPSTPHVKILRSLLKRIESKVRTIQFGVGNPPYLRRYTFPWAVERRKAQYPIP